MADLTIIYITANEMPDYWMRYQVDALREAIGGLGMPIISVSRRPMDLGSNLVDADRKCYWNIYRQICVAAKHAKTKFIAVAEDDTLYSREHFTEFRPDDDAVSYNRARWSVFSWDPIYCLRQRISNCSMIAPRDLIVEAIEERMRKHPNGDDLPNEHVGEVGRHDIEARLGVTKRKKVEWWSTTPVVQLNHPQGTDERQRAQRKSHGQLKATDIPHWGPATALAERYNTGNIVDSASLGAKRVQRIIRKWFKVRVSGDCLPISSGRGTRMTLADCWNDLGYARGAEIGVERADFAVEILRRVANCHLTCIDPWLLCDGTASQQFEARFIVARDRLQPFLDQGRASLLRMTSMDALCHIDDESLDFVFIDGDHAFDCVSMDIIQYSRKVRSGGMVAVHDYLAMRQAGVMKAVDAYTHSHKIDPWFVTREKYPTAFWVKP